MFTIMARPLVAMKPWRTGWHRALGPSISRFSTHGESVGSKIQQPNIYFGGAPGEPDPRFGQFEIQTAASVVNTNLAGNVLGGELLELTDRAGAAVCTRYCNAMAEERLRGIEAVIVRYGHIDFWSPARLTDVLLAQAKLVYVRGHRMVAIIHIWADDVFTRQRRIISRTFGWFDAICPDGSRTYEPPPFVPTNELETQVHDLCTNVYEHLSTSRCSSLFGDQAVTKADQSPPTPAPSVSLPIVVPPSSPNAENAITVDKSKSELSSLVLPSHCYGAKSLARNGVLANLMDKSARLCAMRHSRESSVVTASVSALEFLTNVEVGNLVKAESEIVFVNEDSMEVKVDVTVTNFFKRTDQLCSQGLFRFVVLDKGENVMPVLPLSLTTTGQWANYNAALQRHAEHSRLRAAAQSSFQMHV